MDAIFSAATTKRHEPISELVGYLDTPVFQKPGLVPPWNRLAHPGDVGVECVGLLACLVYPVAHAAEPPAGPA